MQLLFYAVAIFKNAHDTNVNELEFSVSLIKEKFYSGYQPFLMNFLRDKNLQFGILLSTKRKMLEKHSAL